MAKPPYQVRIKDKVLEKEVDACIEDVENQLGANKRGAQSIALERLLHKAFDDERRYREEIERLSDVVKDLCESIADLRKEVAEVRHDFGHCLQTLIVAAKLVPEDTAERWFVQYLRDGKMEE